jgi:predicted enzyme related to lactoylglutathione lyase
MERPVNLNTARVFVRDIEEAKNFYSGALGLPIKAGSSSHGYVPDAHATYEQLRANGVTFNETPERQPWGGVIATLVDPAGKCTSNLRTTSSVVFERRRRQTCPPPAVIRRTQQ